jgi:GAF domain-containing protein/HAMP domain-containing protein
VNIALPLRDHETGEIIGIMRTTYIVSPLTTILAEKVGQTGESDLFFPGEVVSHIHKGEFGPAEAGVFEALQAVFDQGMAEMEYEGTLSVVTQAQVQTLEGNPAVDNLDWVVVMHQQQDEAFAPVNAAIQGFIIVLLIVVALAIVVAYFIAQLLTRPIIQLTLTAEEVSAGNIDSRAEVTTSDEVGTLATAFNSMTSQLREFIGTLEQRVADRTKAIATSSEVSRRLSTILDRETLVKEVVEQLVTAFDYYYAHIYLFNENKDTLIMMGGTGEAGQTMLARGHTIPKGAGMVGRAGESNQVVLAADTSVEDGWLPNELLPETRSELAVPISIGDTVLGVFDVQHSVVNGLTGEDADLMTSIANQVAVALQNIESAETVAKRAVELQTVATISTATATIQDSQEMLATVVNLTQRQFDLYHAHVFLYNENSKDLEIVACGWQEGVEHEGTHGTEAISIDQEQSLVARSARTRQAVIVNNVQIEPGWLPNPQLPDTRAEMAVPLLVGNQLLGVMDVQADRIDAFSEEDANIQTTLASQVATALQNAQTYSEAQQQAEHETTLNLISQKLQNAATIEEALQTAVRELGHALGGKQTLVALDPDALSGDVKSDDGQDTPITPELTETGVEK